MKLKEKQCAKCKIVKLLDKFSKNCKSKDGFGFWCKLCQKEYISIYQKSDKYKKYEKTPSRKFTVYKSSCGKYKGIDFDLTFEEFMTFWQKSCSYCGDGISTIGIDRKNSKDGYNIKNCTSCCWKCNKMKNKDNSELFIEHCKKVAFNNV